MLRMKPTLDEVRAMLDTLVEECMAKRVSLSDDPEDDRLRDVIRCAHAMRGASLDLSVAMTRYVQTCLDRETEREVAP